MSRSRYLGAPMIFPVPHLSGPPGGSTTNLLVPIDVLIRWFYRVKTWSVGFGDFDATATTAVSASYGGRPATIEMRFAGASSHGNFSGVLTEAYLPGYPSYFTLPGPPSVGGVGTYTATGAAAPADPYTTIVGPKYQDSAFWSPFGRAGLGYSEITDDPATQLYWLRPAVSLSAVVSFIDVTHPTYEAGPDFFVGIADTPVLFGGSEIVAASFP